MKDYEITKEQLDAILAASKPTPVLYITGGQNIGGTPQENANRAWEKLGKEMDFQYMTVQPNGKGERFFSAEPL